MLLGAVLRRGGPRDEDAIPCFVRRVLCASGCWFGLVFDIFRAYVIDCGGDGDCLARVFTSGIAQRNVGLGTRLERGSVWFVVGGVAGVESSFTWRHLAARHETFNQSTPASARQLARLRLRTDMAAVAQAQNHEFEA